MSEPLQRRVNVWMRVDSTSEQRRRLSEECSAELKVNGETEEEGERGEGEEEEEGWEYWS